VFPGQVDLRHSTRIDEWGSGTIRRHIEDNTPTKSKEES